MILPMFFQQQLITKEKDKTSFHFKINTLFSCIFLRIKKQLVR